MWKPSSARQATRIFSTAKKKTADIQAEAAVWEKFLDNHTPILYTDLRRGDYVFREQEDGLMPMGIVLDRADLFGNIHVLFRSKTDGRTVQTWVRACRYVFVRDRQQAYELSIDWLSRQSGETREKVTEQMRNETMRDDFFFNSAELDG